MCNYGGNSTNNALVPSELMLIAQKVLIRQRYCGIIQIRVAKIHNALVPRELMLYQEMG